MTERSLHTQPVALSPAQRAFLLRLSPAEVDCAIAVMLKILDGKCKMPPHEARIMTAVYDVVRHRPALALGADCHRMIATARAENAQRYRADVYEARVLAETRISRPVMKAFKATLRMHGVLPGRNHQTSPGSF
ncbi:hypothetical protein [Tropicimonas isoalkanivorans]|uniref:Uncharacterized protein n=1 Tax=Tropicimonas isoalkanivorans TaxID=441112 RepID=A0A1I1H5G0_9RHOB|nr:hypothetical protein [Tropicimonas isoalkanivorans]SFC19006.1 hypothetical protein SAMN04488094_10325 [Tropicimonas isoalkanivorans]